MLSWWWELNAIFSQKSKKLWYCFLTLLFKWYASLLLLYNSIFYNYVLLRRYCCQLYELQVNVGVHSRAKCSSIIYLFTSLKTFPIRRLSRFYLLEIDIRHLWAASNFTFETIFNNAEPAGVTYVRYTPSAIWLVNNSFLPVKFRKPHPYLFRFLTSSEEWSFPQIQIIIVSSKNLSLTLLSMTI